jgi:transposase
VLEPLAAACKTAVIPANANQREPDLLYRHIYGARHLIESFFGKIKQFRAIAMRDDESARRFLGAVQLVASAIWLN